MDGVLNIKESYLDELIKFHSSSLVGKSCKRFEILDNTNDIKRNVKELIYEEFRSLLDNIKAYDAGYGEITIYKFKSRG